jgi:hypothetical protein
MDRTGTEVSLNHLLSGGVVAYQRAIAHAVGDALSGLLFSQLWYWTGRQPEDREGWFFLTQEQIFFETAITRREQETCRRRLRELRILEEERRGHPAKLWFRINVRAVIQLIEKTANSQYVGKRHTRMAENAILEWRKTPSQNGGFRHTSKNTSKTSSKTSAAPAATPPEDSPHGSPRGEGAAAALIEELVSHGVGLSAAEQLARSKPDTCRRYLAYLPYAQCRTTKGAWLVNAIRDEYGPPAGYEKAQAEKARAAKVRGVQKTPRPSHDSALQHAKAERLRSAYLQLEKTQPGAILAFEAFVKAEREKAERFSQVLSPERQALVVAEFGRPERRLELFGLWLQTTKHDRAPAVGPSEAVARVAEVG